MSVGIEPVMPELTEADWQALKTLATHPTTGAVINPAAVYDAVGVAALIPGCSPGSLAQMRGRGLGPAYIQHTPYSRVTYRGSDLLAWLEAGRRTPGTGRRTPGGVTVTVTAEGLGGSRATVTIAGETLAGDVTALSPALWDTPVDGGLITVGGASIHVPHEAAGRTASATLAGLAATPGGGTWTGVVTPGQDPFGD